MMMLPIVNLEQGVVSEEINCQQNLENVLAEIKNRSIGPELMTAKTGPIHLSSLVEIAFVD